MIYIRPFIGSLWAALAGRAKVARQLAIEEPQQARKRKLPTTLIHTKRFRYALIWVKAFLGGARCTLTRVCPLYPQPVVCVATLAVDASPWGLGGALVVGGVVVRWFADELTTQDLRRFNAKKGGLCL